MILLLLFLLMLICLHRHWRAPCLLIYSKLSKQEPAVWSLDMSSTAGYQVRACVSPCGCLTRNGASLRSLLHPLPHHFLPRLWLQLHRRGYSGVRRGYESSSRRPAA
jgi:hypothetical protein